MSLLASLGLDEEDLVWEQLAACRDLPPNMINLMFDDYEVDEVIAEQADVMCLGCPVIKDCLIYGEDNNEWGVWGGIYLQNGKPDKNRATHKYNDAGDKTDAMKRLEKIHGRVFKIRQTSSEGDS
jgi:hypothetical protein